MWEHVREDGRLDISEGPDRVYSLDDLREVMGTQGGGPEDWPGPSADNEEVKFLNHLSFQVLLCIFYNF